MIIQHNIMAINSHRQLGINNTNLQKNLEKLSSGYRINKAADDAAGLAISEKMRAQITGLDRAILNAQDGASLIQTAEGALSEVHSMLNRMVELATQSANGTIQDVDREKIESELTALKDEVDRISKATNFNSINLLDGSLSESKVGTIGAGTELTTNASAVITKYSGANLPVNTASNTITVAASSNALTVTYNNESGDDVTRTVDLGAVTSFYTADGTKSATGEGGGYAEIDLTTVGLGRLRVQFDSDATNVTAADLGTDIAAAFDGVAVTNDGSGGLTMQVGDTAADFNKITVQVDKLDAEGLGIKDIHMNTQEAAAAALDKVKSAIEKVSQNRGNLGALQNRLEHTINNLGVTSENMTASESRIRDVDMAKEMMAFTKNNVLSQAAQAMLAQANMQPQQVLQLLR